jgi:hypothetical protein
MPQREECSAFSDVYFFHELSPSLQAYKMSLQTYIYVRIVSFQMSSYYAARYFYPSSPQECQTSYRVHRCIIFQACLQHLHMYSMESFRRGLVELRTLAIWATVIYCYWLFLPFA